MNEHNITILSKEQVWGNEYEDQLDVIKKYGVRASATDLSALTGGDFYNATDKNVGGDSSLRGRPGRFMVKISDTHTETAGVNIDGRGTRFYGIEDNGIIRPILPFPYNFRKIIKKRVKGYNDTEEVEYGEYPQYVADLSTQTALESMADVFCINAGNKTGRTYTFDSHGWYEEEIKPVTYEEYEYKGKKYIRIKVNEPMYLCSNGCRYKYGDYVWVEVSPVVWLIDKKTKTLISKRGLVSGVYAENFQKYLDTYMSKDLFQNVPLLQNNYSVNDKQGQGQQGNDSKNQEQNNNDLENTQQGKQQPSKKDIGHDTHNMWERAVKEHKKKQEKSGKKSLLDKILGRDKKPEEKTELEKEQEKAENLDEKDAFKQNLEDKKRTLEELKQEIYNLAAKVETIMSNVGTTTNEDIRIVNDIGVADPSLDWQYILREAIKYDTEIVLDTSGSINETLLKNFLRECKNILQHSRLKVGCFDTEFYGFHDIRTEKDIEDMRFEGGGGTDFNAAVEAFSRRVENKIIFTDGESSMPDMPLNAIWIVFGEKQINPKGGKVIRITPEQLRKLCSFEVENETKGRSR